MEIKFFWNGIKEGNGKLQRCHYSCGMLINFPVGTITIYARDYAPFSGGIQRAFSVTNDSDIYTDYIVQDVIRVQPDHPLYRKVRAALDAQAAHHQAMYVKRRMKHEARQAA